MNTKSKYFLFASLFLIVFLVVQFTDMYGTSKWFKAFLLILFFSFIVSGISKSNKPKS
jgi:hypothetical protein